LQELLPQKITMPAIVNKNPAFVRKHLRQGYY
jgi:hypothetical protein